MASSRNIRGAVIFLLASILILIYDVIGHYTHPEWGTQVPQWLHPAMPFMFNVGVPLVFILGSFSAAYALSGARGGLIGIILLGVLAGGWNFLPTIWRLQAGAPYGAAICVFEIIAAALSIRYAVAALQELRTEEGRSAATTPVGV